MQTVLLDGKDQKDIALAGEILRKGGLVAIPTETVYGLAANALDPGAVRGIFAAKNRPVDNPLIVHIADPAQLPPLVREIPDRARKLMEAFWPGPLTLILPKAGIVPSETSGGLDTVAVRFPSHPVARAVIRAAGVPLAAPSANPSGRPSPTSFAHVKKDLTGKVDALLDGGDCDVGVESTVVTLADGTPRLLRPGGITLTQLRSVLGKVDVDPAVIGELKEGEKASSPGMKYKHYAPKADVVLVDASPRGYINYVNSTSGCHALCFDEDASGLQVPYLSCGSRYDSARQARSLFAALYRLDEMGAEKVCAHMPSRTGIGLAVWNRLIRAAGFQVICPEEHTVVGLTGPSGAGKSSVGEQLRKLGWTVIDCDGLTRSGEVYHAGCIAELCRAFGEDVAPGGVLDRALLAQRAFAGADSKRTLEEIVFPHILKAVHRAAENAFAEGAKVVVLDAPTLFESRLDSICRRIIAVTAPEEERMRRVCLRDGLTREQAAGRFAAQHPESYYTCRADCTVENGAGKDLSAVPEQITGELGL